MSSSFSTKFRLYMLKLIHIFGNVLMGNNRFYVKRFILPCTFLKFHTHLEKNLARSFQNVFDRFSRVLNLVLKYSWKSPYFRIPYHFKWSFSVFIGPLGYRSNVTRILLFWVNSVVKSLLWGFIHKHASVKQRLRYQMNFIREGWL